jgi:regulator of nucleoside diphosphate kinase
MHIDESFDRTLTELDHARITRLTRGDGGPSRNRSGDPLESALDAASLVPSRAVPADVVTMNSQVLIRDLETSRQHQLTLCYPADAEPELGRVSVLSPVGASLLGLRAGDEASWTTPNGEQRTARVEKVLFQPESSGDYTR